MKTQRSLINPPYTSRKSATINNKDVKSFTPQIELNRGTKRFETIDLMSKLKLETQTQNSHRLNIKTITPSNFTSNRVSYYTTQASGLQTPSMITPTHGRK